MDYLYNINIEGFTIINNIYSKEEIERVIFEIEKVTQNKKEHSVFRRTEDLFAIRQFFKEIPSTLNIIFNHNLQQIIKSNFGEDYFITKSIYFDKPEKSNWYVAYHQDLTISVDKKIQTDGFEKWTNKQNQYAVQPPIEILENNFTIRIHLDKTTKDNGALKVLNKSHKNGMIRTVNLNMNTLEERICDAGQTLLNFEQ